MAEKHREHDNWTFVLCRHPALSFLSPPTCYYRFSCLPRLASSPLVCGARALRPACLLPAACRLPARSECAAAKEQAAALEAALRKTQQDAEHKLHAAEQRHISELERAVALALERARGEHGREREQEQELHRAAEKRLEEERRALAARLAARDKELLERARRVARLEEQLLQAQVRLRCGAVWCGAVRCAAVQRITEGGRERMRGAFFCWMRARPEGCICVHRVFQSENGTQDSNNSHLSFPPACCVFACVDARMLPAHFDPGAERGLEGLRASAARRTGPFRQRKRGHQRRGRRHSLGRRKRARAIDTIRSVFTVAGGGGRSTGIQGGRRRKRQSRGLCRDTSSNNCSSSEGGSHGHHSPGEIAACDSRRGRCRSCFCRRCRT